MTPRDAAYLSDIVEAHAFADLYSAAPAQLQAQLGLRVATVADATLLLAPKLPTPMFNRAIGLGMAVPATDQSLEAIRAAFGDAGVASWWLHWNPHSKPDDFPERLRKQGFVEARRRSWAKMLWRGSTPPQISTDLRIEPVGDAQARETTKTIAQIFEMPPPLAEWIASLHGRPGWRLYAVMDAGAIVGGGALFIEEDRAWLGLGSVLPSHRRRGGQGALMARRIADAIDLGAIQIVTETGEPIDDEPNPSLANMARCGFDRVASRLNFVAPG